MTPAQTDSKTPPKHRYSVVRLSTENPADTLFPLWSENLPVQGQNQAKYDWYYERSPLGPGVNFLLKLEGSKGESVGCCGLGQRLMMVYGHPIHAGLLSDFAVTPAHRTGLPALMLQRILTQHARSTYALTYGFPNSAAVAVFRRVGYQTLGRMERYVRVLRHAPYLERVQVKTPLRQPLSVLLDGVERIRHRFLSRQKRTPQDLYLAFLQPEQVDARFDQLFQEQRAHYPLIAVRNATFLTWRFLQQPGEHYEVVALLDRADNLHAYAVIQMQGDQVHIRDLFGRDLAALLLALEGSLRARGAMMMSLRFLGAGWMKNLLLSLGYRNRGAEREVVVGIADPKSAERDKDPAPLFDLRNVYKSPEAYYLTDADEDN